MHDDVYRLAGTVRIPEDKKSEFNRNVLRILDVCGIRKTERIMSGGKRIAVVRRPEPDRQGIVRFDYSIFEKKKRKTAFYNMRDCGLTAPDRGNDEFGVVMNMIMTLQESYSKEPCYFMYKNRPCNVNAYALLIQDVLGIALTFPNRANMWDMYLFLKKKREYQNVTSEMIQNAFPSDFCEIIPEQFFAVRQIDAAGTEASEEPFGREEAEDARMQNGKLLYYIRRSMNGFTDKKEKALLKNYLRTLLEADLQKRRELTEDVKYGMIAAASLYVLPPVIVLGYALAVRQDFWDAWRELGIKGYGEVIADKRGEKTEKVEKDKRKLPFYKAIRRDCEDEFIEFWKDGNLDFSENMKVCLSDWKARFAETTLENNVDAEILITQIAAKLNRIKGCRLADKAWITEFMEHSDIEEYKRALLFYRDLIDVNLRPFCFAAHIPVHSASFGSHLLKFMKKRGVRRMVGDKRRKCTETGAFQSLLMNHKLRFEILGF